MRKHKASKQDFAKYENMANIIGIDFLKELVPANRSELISAYKKDRWLNTIPLHKWDGASIPRKHYEAEFPNRDIIGRRFKQNGGSESGGFSAANAVSVLKHVAIYKIIGLQPDFEDGE